MRTLGIILTGATLLILVVEFVRKRRHRFPAHGWLGLLALAGAEYLMLHGIEPVATYFTPLAWTAYILLADAAIFAVSGHSRFRDEPLGLLKMAALSVPLWLIFEAYNLRLANWLYVGLPEGIAERWFGYAWSFATITPGIFLTASLIESFGWFAPESRPVRFARATEIRFMIAGAALLIVPVIVPQRVGAYLFGLIWLGFTFLLDPVNYRLHLPSFEGDLARGYRGRIYSFLIAGWVCGCLWEFWNYWAAAKWIYTFPLFQHWKIFEMPAPGYLGFPCFAIECFTMYVTAAWICSRKYVAERKYQEDPRA
jgi:hypothetical protein